MGSLLSKTVKLRFVKRGYSCHALYRWHKSRQEMGVMMWQIARGA
jgi:hypothetical protein